MFVFFFKQKTAYEMRISDWSSDVCSSDLWQDRDGNDRYTTEVVIAGMGGNLTMLDGAPGGGGSRGGSDWNQGGGSSGGWDQGGASGGSSGGGGWNQGEIGREPCRARVCQAV